MLPIEGFWQTSFSTAKQNDERYQKVLEIFLVICILHLVTIYSHILVSLYCIQISS